MCEVSIEWDPAPVEMVWELEIARKEPNIIFDAFKKVYEGTFPLCTIKDLKMGTEYVARVCGKIGDGKWGEWSDALCFKTKKWTCSWKQCPKTVEEKRKYSMSGKLDNIATKLEVTRGTAREIESIVIGDTPIPIGVTVSWKISIGYGNSHYCRFYFGIAPTDVNQNEEIYLSDATYIDSYGCSIRSRHNEYSLFSGLTSDGKDVFLSKRIWGSLGVIVNTIKREVSFVVNGVIFGIAPNILVDKPLVPLVVLNHSGDKAELMVE